MYSRSCAGEEYYSKGAITMSVPVVTIIGKSGSGKTMLMEKMIGELKDRGHNIGTLKHHSHAGFDIDRPGKDSWRHAKAGSDHVIIAAPDKIASYRLLDQELEFEEVITEFEDVDVVLVEGYKSANRPSIEVIREENGLELISDPEQRLAIAADAKLDTDVPLFDLNDVQGMADLVEERFLE